MAGDWIKMEICTPEKPEVLGIADRLDMPPAHVVGCLFLVWRWFDQHTTDGNAVSVTENAIDRITSVTGFADALISVGWLAVRDDDDRTGLTLPNFDRHNGKTAKTRAQTAKRVAKSKANKGNDLVTQEALPREEKRRINTPLPPKGGKADRFSLPEELAENAELAAAWAEYLRHRREAKHKSTPTWAEKQIKRIRELGAAEAAARLRRAVANGWQGWDFARDAGPNGKQSPSNGRRETEEEIIERTRRENAANA